MVEREKVIKGLECCPVHCNPECPYYWNDISDFTECQIRLHMYAIDLRKSGSNHSEKYDPEGIDK